MSVIFANHQQFELACRKFIEKHAQDQKKAEDESGYPSRVLAGWSWKDHPVYPNQGYMIKKDTKRAITPSELSNEGEIEEMSEEDDPGASLSDANASSSITVEWIVVYSKTYRIPQLCFNAYGPTGTPLSLAELMSTGIFLQTPRDTSAVHDDHLDLDTGHNPLDAGAQFPLLQRISHPYPYTISPNFVETVWSIHPCHVQDTVAEVLSTEAGPRKDESSAQTGAGILDVESRGDGLVEHHVVWLESWFMVTSTLMHLRR